MGVGARKAKPKAKGGWARSSNPLPSWTITQVGVPQKLPGSPSLPNPPCQTLSLWGSPVSLNTSETNQVTGPDLKIVIVNKEVTDCTVGFFCKVSGGTCLKPKVKHLVLILAYRIEMLRGNVNLIHTRYSLPSYRVHILIIKL